MKCRNVNSNHLDIMSPLAMAEWIEIPTYLLMYPLIRSPLAMAEWIEMLHRLYHFLIHLSPLAMAEWIEIPICHPIRITHQGLR